MLLDVFYSLWFLSASHCILSCMFVFNFSEFHLLVFFECDDIRSNDDDDNDIILEIC